IRLPDSDLRWRGVGLAQFARGLADLSLCSGDLRKRLPVLIARGCLSRPRLRDGGLGGCDALACRFELRVRGCSRRRCLVELLTRDHVFLKEVLVSSYVGACAFGFSFRCG